VVKRYFLKYNYNIWSFTPLNIILFTYPGILCLVLNSQYYEDHSHIEEEYLKQEAWLDEQLNLVKSHLCTHCIVFQHIPWFLQTPDEDKEYFNIEKDTRFRMLDKLRSAGVRHIFCGHYHRNAGGFYGDLELVVTSAVGCQLGNDAPGMRIVRVTKDKVQHKYYELEKDFPHKLDLEGDVELP